MLGAYTFTNNTLNSNIMLLSGHGFYALGLCDLNLCKLCTQLSGSPYRSMHIKAYKLKS